MKNMRIIWIGLLFLSLIFTSCNNEDLKIKIKEEKIEEIPKNSPLTNMSIDNIVNNFEENSKRHKIEIEKFSKLNLENKSFYYSKIGIKEDSAYTINFEGIDIQGLYMKTGMKNGTELAMIEEMVINLIEVSDSTIKEEEARKIYNEILATMKEEELSNELKYKNGILYGIKIDQNTGELIFFAQ